MDKHDGPATPQPHAGPGMPPPGWGPPRRPTNSTAIAALVVGLVSLMSCPLIGAAAVYLGNRARAEIRATGQEGDGLALAGVIIGWIALGLTVLTVLFLVVYFAIFGAVLSNSGTA